MTQRRTFILTLVPATLAVGASLRANAQAAKIEETDPAAKAVKYVHDASKLDPAKNAPYVKGSVCGGCALFAGKAGDAWAPCAIVANKQVNAKGWCSAWNKKAA
jgi:hypothetical protein